MNTWKEYFAEVGGVIEANSYETIALWQEYSKKYDWERGGEGKLATINQVTIDGETYPICISVFKKKIGGLVILFWEATSAVVHYDYINEWLKENLPDGVTSTNAMNAHIVLFKAKAKE